MMASVSTAVTLLVAFTVIQISSQDAVWPDAPGPVAVQPTDPADLQTTQCCTPTQWHGVENNNFLGVTGEFWFDNRLRLGLITRSDGSWQLYDEQVGKNYTMLADGFCYAPPLQPFYRTSRCIAPNATYVGQYVEDNELGRVVEQWAFTYPNGLSGVVAYDAQCMIAMQVLRGRDGVTEVMNFTYPERTIRFFDLDLFDMVDTSSCVDMNDFEYNVNMTEFRNEYLYYY